VAALLLSSHDLFPQTSSLTLSAALLRAILMNHLAHSEASRLAKNVESTLKTKLDDLENAYTQLDTELRRYVSPLSSLTPLLTRRLASPLDK
jgi:hypothetical protein